MLEHFSARVRHILILVLGGVTTTGSTVVFEVSPAWASVIGIILTSLGLSATPLTRQYGVGR